MSGSERNRQAFLPRMIVVLGALALGTAAALLFHSSLGPRAISNIDWSRVVLVFFSVFWLGWGAVTALLGVFWRQPSNIGASLDGIPMPTFKTAILVPIYNENAPEVFNRIRIMRDDLMAAGCLTQFDFHVLSDTRCETLVAEERQCHLKLAQDPGIPVYYRNRVSNEGRKAGNIKEFVTRCGGAYETMLVLDADSLMTAQCMMRMVKAMAQERDLGLLQTVPIVIGASSVFARIVAFATGLYGRTFARGLTVLQGTCGPFWGHNAIIRTRAFAQSCGLPVLKGEGPLSGHILSHDTVEAALLARKGWQVRCDAELEGSYEEMPANLLGFAARDRRWCQGNLQHARLLFANGLTLWSRVNITLGITAYLASGLWCLFLILSLVSLGTTSVYERTLRLYLSVNDLDLWFLLGMIVALLFLPKILIAVANVSGYRRGAVSGLAVMLGYFFEVLAAIALAPILMMFQCRGILEILIGRDSGWSTAHRGEGTLTLWESVRATSWMPGFALLALAFGYSISIETLCWSLPVALPVLLAPLIVWVTSKPISTRGASILGLVLHPNQRLGDELRQLGFRDHAIS
ncbi:glucans biosynthesis glucosyltransferase MdoH [Pseudovibrio sp. SPO723]|uniref:glucans biosynthesis glucosyltransferase MdoH n=1 Tax=Nesiotobacter zosterae TaxID=392721 RepID=UPI0029C5075F|nr:glucans biosynthesis glucosyltransferase MdoH [Pseudovibrio sp. SPO723]MDX5594440.1 glucans biosynthesis glucosyltransferase MdoH [Pseudovibrio sp. SPO723]